MMSLACLFLRADACCSAHVGRRNSAAADGDTFGSSTCFGSRFWFRNGDSSCAGAGAGASAAAALMRASFSRTRSAMVGSSATSLFLNPPVISFPPGSLK